MILPEYDRAMPDAYDVLMTAVLFAAEELAKVYPQSEGDSVETWKKYLLQEALKIQDQMTKQERERFRIEHLT